MLLPRDSPELAGLRLLKFGVGLHLSPVGARRIVGRARTRHVRRYHLEFDASCQPRLTPCFTEELRCQIRISDRCRVPLQEPRTMPVLFVTPERLEVPRDRLLVATFQLLLRDELLPESRIALRGVLVED